MKRCGFGRRGWVVAFAVGLMAVVVALWGLMGGHSQAQDGPQTVVFRQGEAGYSGCTDVRITANRPDTNFADDELILGESGRINTLIRFDISSIPPYAMVEEASLSLQVSNYGRYLPFIISGAFPVSRTWHEAQATWNRAEIGQPWGLPGCNDILTDRSAIPAGVTTVTVPGWYSWDVTSAAQRWVQDPGGNHGLLLAQMNPEAMGEADVRHSEYPGVDVRPYLTIRYRLVPPTPTPALTPLHSPCEDQVQPGDLLIVLQNNAAYHGAEDTWLAFDDRGSHNDRDWFMHVGYRRHDSGLIRFDVSSVPRGAMVVCGALGLFAERWSGGALEVGAYLVKRPNIIPQANWTSASSAADWAQGGCNGSTDRKLLPEDTRVVDHILDWYFFDITPVVEGWVNGALDNYGISIQALQELDRDTVWFTSSDDDVGVNRPQLAVWYRFPSASTATPTRTSTPTRTPVHTPTRTSTLVSRRTVTLQVGSDGYTGSVDTRINKAAPSTNYALSNLRVGSERTLASLIRFDLTGSIPSDATVESAVLNLYCYEREGSAGLDVGAHAVRRWWVDSESTWVSAQWQVPWGQSGCESIVTDRAAGATDRAVVGAAGWYSWVVTGDVQDWLHEPGSNLGWLLRAASLQPETVRLYSREHTQVGLRPKLQITYTLP